MGVGAVFVCSSQPFGVQFIQLVTFVAVKATGKADGVRFRGASGAGVNCLTLDVSLPLQAHM